MKKKTITKNRLAFERETVRLLEKQDLARAAGADTGLHCVHTLVPCPNLTHVYTSCF